MIDRKYIVKSLAPWMLDELMVFSEFTSFDLVFLRKQDVFYDEKIELLKSKGVNVHITPFKLTNLVRKMVVVFSFILTNINKFTLNYNSVIALKSIVWFFRLDLSLFSEDSNIHAQFATQPSLVALLIKRYYKNQVSYSFTYHAYDIYFKNRWFNLLVSNCKKAFSISQFNIQYVQRKYLNSEKITLSRLGVFTDTIFEMTTKNDKSKQFTIGLMSWFVEKKGIIFLLQAMKKLKENDYNDIKLILAGDGPLKDTLLEFIDENSLSDSVSYLGKVKDQEKVEFYNSLDTFVLPSIKLNDDQDGIPVVLMEAVAFGLPLISTKVSGIPEICIDNYNGRLIKERDIEGLYTAIVELYGDKKRRSEYSKNSIEISKKYDIIINSRKKLEYLEWI